MTHSLGFFVKKIFRASLTFKLIQGMHAFIKLCNALFNHNTIGCV